MFQKHEICSKTPWIPWKIPSNHPNSGPLVHKFPQKRQDHLLRGRTTAARTATLETHASSLLMAPVRMYACRLHYITLHYIAFTYISVHMYIYIYVRVCAYVYIYFTRTKVLSCALFQNRAVYISLRINVLLSRGLHGGSNLVVALN